jgi:ribonuclease BN (tRNA processing enzyme)
MIDLAEITRRTFILFAALVLSHSVAAQPPAATWVTLGTSGGPMVQKDRSQIANALVVGGSTYLFDVGNGVQRQMALAALPETQIRAIFLSHHHLDHNADLGPLLVTHWTFGKGVLPVYGPAGTKLLVSGLASANAPTELAAFPTGGPARPALSKVVFGSDMSPTRHRKSVVYSDENIRVWAIEVDHFQLPPSMPMKRMPHAVAYRVEAGGRIFVYTGDSGPSPQLVELARDADLLISEVVNLDAITANLERQMATMPAATRVGIIRGMAVNHLAPEEVGKLALAANVKAVVLTHFVPSPRQGDEASWTRGISEYYPGPVRLANDLDRF